MEKTKLTLTSTEEVKLPSNIEAEQSIIGSILVNNDIIDEISNIVNAGKFFDPIHRKIYEVIENLNTKGMIANPITLKNYFDNDSGLSEGGGVDFILRDLGIANRSNGTNGRYMLWAQSRLRPFVTNIGQPKRPSCQRR